jgi:hypothetical protein
MNRQGEIQWQKEFCRAVNFGEARLNIFNFLIYYNFYNLF